MRIIILLFFILFFVLYVRYLESKSVFFPSKDIGATPASLGLKYEEVSFLTRDHIKLHGWFIKSPGSKGTLIFLHGNAGNISDRLEKLHLFDAIGLNTFIFDYRGYGKSEGVPTEEGLYLDAIAAYEYVHSREDVDKKYIFAYGASLGGAIAVDLAVKKELLCLIVDSSFTSAKDMAKRIIPFAPSFLIKTKLDSISKVRDIDVPKLFMHSPADEVVPFSLGKNLFDAAAEPKRFFQTSGGHNDGYSQYPDEFVSAIKSFLKEVRLL